VPAAERIAACDKRRHCGWNGRRRRSSTFFGVPYADLAYRPMLELFEYLKANGSGCSSAPAAAGTSCGCSPREPGRLQGRKASSALPPTTSTSTGKSSARTGCSAPRRWAPASLRTSTRTPAAAAIRRRERRRRHARIGDVRGADQPRRPAPRIRLTPTAPKNPSAPTDLASRVTIAATGPLGPSGPPGGTPTRRHLAIAATLPTNPQNPYEFSVTAPRRLGDGTSARAATVKTVGRTIRP